MKMARLPRRLPILERIEYKSDIELERATFWKRLSVLTALCLLGWFIVANW